MSQNSNFEDDEIDSRELIAALWAHKFLIACLTGISIFLAGYYSLNVEKKFTATSVFQLEENKSGSGFNISGELGVLASLAGLPSGVNSNSTDILFERVMRREFILNMKDRLSLERDTYFNSYDPDYKDPFWKATLKQLIGWHKTELEKNALIESNIVKNYRENILFDETSAGVISLEVTHANSKKASFYANELTEEIRKLVARESSAALDLRLNYLSETLADALQDMDRAQENLKNYAFENSAMAQENFIADSLKLDELRMEKRKVSEISDLLLLIENLIKSGSLDAGSFESLRSNQPLVDDIDFRRILGMSETISAWAWPEIETINAISATLQDRIKRLDVNIKNIEENAQIYAISAEDLARLTRDAKIAEATYTVLIEQVKSQSLAAGFQPETFKVFEYATPPIVPSFPNRKIVLAIGALLGVFIGCVLALINASRKKVYYTRSALISNVNADLALRSGPFKRLSKKSITDIVSVISQRRITALDESTIQLANKKIVYVLNSGGQPTASNTTRLLAAKSAQSGRNVLLCDTTGQSKEGITKKTTTQETGLPIESIGDNLSVITGVDRSSFITSNTFSSTIKDLTNRFDQVFVCTSNRNAQLGLKAILEFVPGLVMIAGLRKTKKSNIKNIKISQPVDILFYD